MSSKAVGKVSCGDIAKKLLTLQNELQPAFEAGCSKIAFGGKNPVVAIRRALVLDDHFMDDGGSDSE